MRVIICGAGQVGYSIAAYLAREANDVTVIDTNPYLISDLNTELDISGVIGHASDPNVLAQAGANEVDLIIAVTHSDEVNMVACQVAHSLFNVPKKIARVRNQSYLAPAWSNLFSRAHMPIDVIISPEIEVARAIYQRLQVPGTTNVITLADGAVYLVGVVCAANCPVVNTPLKQLSTLFPDLHFEIAAIVRDSGVIIPGGDDQMAVGDEVYFFSDSRHLQRVMKAFGHEEVEARRIIIMGGGNVGAYLANILVEENARANVKIIEYNEQRARFLAENVPGAIVLHGSALDHEILREANIAEAETLVAVMNDDENNILGSLLAKQSGCQRAITLVNKPTYLPLISSLGIDATVSPRATTVSSIMQHVRRGRIKALHTLRDGFGEVIEAEVSETSELLNMTLRDVTLPPQVMIGAIVRGNKVLMPKPDRIIQAGDHVITLAVAGQARAVERLFTVQVDLF